MINFKKLMVFIFIGITSTCIYAQETRFAQFSLFPPISTAGVESANYSNCLSLNIVGVTGGLNGVEIGAVANIDKGDVSGYQLAGVVNYTTGNSNGVITSGVTNINLGNATGVFLSGITNKIEGYSLGCFVSGVSNIFDKNSTGIAFTGVLNTANKFNGVQLATINIAENNIKGMQAGVINYAKKANGVQLGVVNICNSADSIVPIGLFNIVRNGYYAFELSTNELLLTSMSYKMGVEKLHTIFRVGVGKDVVSTGLGFGSIIPFNEKHKLNIDLLTDQIIHDNKWGKFNLLGQLNVCYLYQINNHWGIKAGPSIKTYITKNEDSLDIPYTNYDYSWDEYKLSAWVGFNAGIVLKL